MSDIEEHPEEAVADVAAVAESTPPEEVAEEVVAAVAVDEQPIIKKKATRGHRPKLSPSKKVNLLEKTTCPDCHKSITIQCLRYKHARHCTGRLKPKEPAPTPQISQREIVQRVESFNKAESEPAPVYDEMEVVRNYMSRLKKQEQERRQTQVKNLINSALRRNKN